jgi:hypothetical protein
MLATALGYPAWLMMSDGQVSELIRAEVTVNWTMPP